MAAPSPPRARASRRATAWWQLGLVDDVADERVGHVGDLLLAETADGLAPHGDEPDEPDQLEAAALPPPIGDATSTAYLRIDGVHYQIAVADQRVEISIAPTGKRFQPLGHGRWDGARLRELSAELPPNVRSAIEGVLRGAR